MPESNDPEELDEEELEALAMTREELMALWDAGVPAGVARAPGEVRRGLLTVNRVPSRVTVRDCHFDWPWPTSEEGH